MIPEALRDEAQSALAEWGWPLSAGQWELLDHYLSEVLGYGKANLTAAKDMEELVLRHALDGLAALGPLRDRLGSAGAPRLVEVGAGAGFVGMSLKIAWPEASVTLVDSSYKRVCFMNLAASRLRLPGLHVIHATVGGKGKAHGVIRHGALDTGGSAASADRAGAGYDAVLARALAPLPEALNMILPMAKPGGFAMVYQTEAVNGDDPAVRKALEAGRGVLDSVVPYALPREERKRHLAFFRRMEAL